MTLSWLQVEGVDEDDAVWAEEEGEDEEDEYGEADEDVEEEEDEETDEIRAQRGQSVGGWINRCSVLVCRS